MKLKQLRLMSGLKQADFAKQFGISQNSLSNYENGNRKIDLNLLTNIAKKYKCSTDYLLDNDLIYDGRIADALVSEREANGYTLQEVSKITKIPFEDLKAYEMGYEPINQYLLSILCKLYDKTIYSFYVDHEMYDEYIPEVFNGDVDRYEAFKSARDIDNLKSALHITNNRSDAAAYNSTAPALADDSLAISDDEYMKMIEGNGDNKQQEPANSPYYLNPETAAIAQQIHDNPGMRILFDAAKDVSPEDLKTVADLVSKMRKQENGDYE